MVGVCAAVDDAIHVQIQVVKLREKRFIGNDLINLRIALTEPAIKLSVGVINVRHDMIGELLCYNTYHI